MSEHTIANIREGFTGRFSFDLDPFQLSAMDALDRGSSVLVAAPTGAGKTIAGEYAVHRAIAHGVKVFYTTPIKALSNQKYQELVEWLGHEAVGLVTGDVNINSEAQVVVMTTEILRNMMYADSPTLHSLGYVVMDEVHYLADRMRGPVWEEIIIHLPRSVQLVALSATVSNVEEFGAWLEEVRGSTEVIVSERRPIPLWQHVLSDHELIDVFLDEDGQATPSHGPFTHRRYREVNPLLAEIGKDSWEKVPTDRRHGSNRRGRSRKHGRSGRRGYRDRRQDQRGHRRSSRHDQQMRPRAMSRADVVFLLEKKGMLPAIFFIFSRSGCDQAVSQLMRANVRLTDDAERSQIKEAFRAALGDVRADDYDALGIGRIERAAMNGLAAHHAGQLPAVKAVIEDLFARGLVKVVCATETLALGINMPARTVVLDKLTKFNGTEHAQITPGEYTQLTGRAGRRGIDVEGHAVVVVGSSVAAQDVAGLASTRTYKLRSAFRPTYNMAVNLLGRYSLEEAYETLESSFAQFHTDRSVVAQARKAREKHDVAEQYREAMHCSKGDIAEYADILEKISAREKELSRNRADKQRERTRSIVGKLRRGEIIAIPGGRRSGFAVVIDHEKTVKGPRVWVVTREGQLRDLYTEDFSASPMVLETMRVPSLDRIRSARVRKDTASALREKLRGEESPRKAVRARSTGKTANLNHDPLLVELREALRAHPCHHCEEREQHMRWISRYRKAAREAARAERTVTQRTSHLVRQFDRVRAVLEALGYVGEADATGHVSVTSKGELLKRVYSERDLIVCEALDQGVLEGLSPDALAAVASALSYEPRRDDGGSEDHDDRAVTRALYALSFLVDDINVQERRAGLEQTPAPHPGLCSAVYRWAHGEGFAQSVGNIPVAPGDFVRHVRQVIDLLDHLAHVPGAAHTGVAATARKARLQLLRGIVAQDM
ncbi:DEAD/DEAH box helicase [Dermabacter vaginalis]|uniref:DEAD/DEAH box helicase n=1 Tax=Dermabacter vaginalis TaxID=1630135 RepID=UPI0021A38E6D|nr:DEAD/DEAH box helicase [Dermabacter vaginalis]MCT2149694.1 DEAD/DEAH box helicase [Dermabacter vaginalis]